MIKKKFIFGAIINAVVIFSIGFYFNQILNFIFSFPSQFILLIILFLESIFSIRLFLKYKHFKSMYNYEHEELEKTESELYKLQVRQRKNKIKFTKLKTTV